ncbi:hypothetical protein EGW08_000314 [Elysia chlorotica]|uniref:Methyltransferase domain-containing protein n=1 Tax=Elysia chlorotica TaxID=188477 RepID=A0A3S1CGD9_ELYCH|nr:hypothetical protein EGW08_000314 [Elysia chlorotica]
MLAALLKYFGNYSASARVLFPLCFLLLCVGFLYIQNVITIPSGPDLCKIWKERSSNHVNRAEDKQWWEWVCQLEREWDKKPEYSCADKRDIGNYQACFDEPYKPSPPCLVYSFGVNNDFRFDDKMAKLGCHVYAFDPSMNVASYNRSERVHFINIGIGTSNSDSFQPKLDGYNTDLDKKWQIRTLASIKKMLGHENKVLDILKMDIETYEWKVVMQLLEDKSFMSAKQLLIEWHIFSNEPMRTDFPDMYRTYMRLKMKGWRQFYSRVDSRHHTNEYFNSQMDNGLVNTAFTRY